MSCASEKTEKSVRKTKHSAVKQIGKLITDEVPIEIIPDTEVPQDKIIQRDRSKRTLEEKKRWKKRRSFKLFNVQKGSSPKSKETKMGRPMRGNSKGILKKSQEGKIKTIDNSNHPLNSKQIEQLSKNETAEILSGSNLDTEAKDEIIQSGKKKKIPTEKQTLSLSPVKGDGSLNETKRVRLKRGNLDESLITTEEGTVKVLTSNEMKRGRMNSDKKKLKEVINFKDNKMQPKSDTHRRPKKINLNEFSDVVNNDISKTCTPEETDTAKNKADTSNGNYIPHEKTKRSLGRTNKMAEKNVDTIENDGTIATKNKRDTQKRPNSDINEEAENSGMNMEVSDTTVSRNRRVKQKKNYKELHSCGMNVEEIITPMKLEDNRNSQKNSDILESNPRVGDSSESKNKTDLANPLEIDSEDSDDESDGDLFECGVCNDEFNSKEQLLAHIETHDGVQFMLLHEVDEEEEQVQLRYECPHCPLPFESAEDLDHHIKDHFGKENNSNEDEDEDEKDVGRRRDFVCDICEKKYEKNFALQHHIQTVHYGIKRFACNVCDKRFSLSGTLKKHMNIHGNVRPYKCKECKYSCNQRGTLVRHVQRKHLKEKRYGCEICGKLFVTKYEVFQHHNKGHNEDLLQCTLCEYKCKDVDTLKNHLRIHNETPYKCKLCSRKFSDYEFFQDHVRTHKGQKAYKCSFCSWTGNHNTAFSYHLKRDHPNEMPYPCTKCDEKFDTHAKLKRHMLYHTADQIYMCEKCSFITKTWSQLKEHYFGKEIDNIINKCRICEEKFGSLEDVQEHMSDHCIRKRLRNVPTVSTKTQKDWFKCHYCYKKFRSKISLNIHMKSHGESERRRIKQELRLTEEEEEEEEVIQKEIITCDASIQFDGEEFAHVKREKNEDVPLFETLNEYIIDDSKGSVHDESLKNREEVQQPAFVSTSRIISTEELMSMESSSQYQIVYDENDLENASGTIRELLDDWE